MIDLRNQLEHQGTTSMFVYCNYIYTYYIYAYGFWNVACVCDINIHVSWFIEKADVHYQQKNKIIILFVALHVVIK